MVKHADEIGVAGFQREQYLTLLGLEHRSDILGCGSFDVGLWTDSRFTPGRMTFACGGG